MVIMRTLILGITAVVLAATYYGLHRLGETNAPGGDIGIQGSADSLQAAADIAIAIDSTQPATARVIRVKQGDRVRLSVTSDRSGALEVHGYHEEAHVEPGNKTTLSFVAAKTGRFPIDLHGPDRAHMELGALEVLPR